MVFLFILLVLPVHVLGGGNQDSHGEENDAVKYDQNSPEFQQTASELRCLCGCGQSHLDCSMDGCGINDSVLAEILEKLNEGMAPPEIKDYFQDVYGEQILMAPEKSGFSLTAWVTPFVALGGSLVGVTVLLRKWARKSKNDDDFGDGADDELEDDVETEILESIIDEERKKYY